MIDRKGQVWVDRFHGGEGDICLCAETVEITPTEPWRHLFLNLETGTLNYLWEDEVNTLEEEPGWMRLA